MEKIMESLPQLRAVKKTTYNSIITQNTLDINNREDGISLISFI